MKVETKPNPIPFGIYRGSKQTAYGKYTWGEYKGKKIEIFDAKKYEQKLIYVADSKTLKWIKSKLISYKNGIVDKILTSSARNR